MDRRVSIVNVIVGIIEIGKDIRIDTVRAANRAEEEVIDRVEVIETGAARRSPDTERTEEDDMMIKEETGRGRRSGLGIEGLIMKRENTKTRGEKRKERGNGVGENIEMVIVVMVNVIATKKNDTETHIENPTDTARLRHVGDSVVRIVFNSAF